MRLPLAFLLLGALPRGAARRVIPSASERAEAIFFFEPTFPEDESILNLTRQLRSSSSKHGIGSPSSSLSASANSHLVTSLPGLKASDYPHRHWAGHIPVRGTGHLFYWLFEAWEAPTTAPLVVWFNGGPGCTSMDGLFLENGPFRLTDKLDVTVHPHAWPKVANVLYVDQPVGTGLSYTTGPSASSYRAPRPPPP